MRILHVTRDYPEPCRGGISTAVAGLVRTSVATGLRVAVISLERERARDGERVERMELDGVAIARIGSPTVVDAAFAQLGFPRPDVVHVHEPLAWPSLAPRVGDCKMVATVHVDHERMAQLRGATDPISNRSLGAYRQLLADAVRLIVPSRAAADAVRMAYARSEERISVVPHGIATASESHRPARDKLLVHIGRFDTAKGTADAAAAIVEALERRPDWRAVIAGGLPANARGERRWRRGWRTTWPAEVSRRIELCGWVDAIARDALLARAGVVIVPSHYETFGLTALEALAQAAPVVASEAGGLPEIVRHGQTGLTFAPGDREQLVRAILTMMDDPGSAQRLGENGAADVRQRFRWRDAVAATVAEYERALTL